MRVSGSLVVVEGVEASGEATEEVAETHVTRLPGTLGPQ